jgi:transposase-like protein
MPGSGKQKPADAEISRILRENKQLKLENEFLKKAAVYFAKDHK